ncbi:nuclear transport factor 2 family protein [Tunicatimonas pelagia]|uniref:nuclear transport factor 2 family protein n=1 Tax=Tunicatimonas pelagia TaxID=931531 RepID=UPI0026655177|nr:nuclear transport factor 2 family protein [Tunicatimonas pelagia]WKN44597.1 nuclear transport factor 2 family protein [Tunicatimonas pelagia]
MKRYCLLFFVNLAFVFSAAAQSSIPLSTQNITPIDVKTEDGNKLSHLNQPPPRLLSSANTLPTETVEEIVQRQLDAYNARDIDAFMDTYADSIALYSFPNELRTKGKEAMRTTYSQLFERTPNLYAEIKNRIVIGNKVIDQEYVRAGERFIDAVAIYEVADGKIVRVTFIRG